jgi:hypothetical protein
MWDTRQTGSAAHTRSRDGGIASRAELFGVRMESVKYHCSLFYTREPHGLS